MPRYRSRRFATATLPSVFGTERGEEEHLQQALSLQPHGDVLVSRLSEIRDAMVLAQLVQSFESTVNSGQTVLPINSVDDLVPFLGRLGLPAETTRDVQADLPPSFLPVSSVADFRQKCRLFLDITHLL